MTILTTRENGADCNAVSSVLQVPFEGWYSFVFDFIYEDEAKRRDFDAESRRELEDTNGPRGSTLVLRQPLALHHHHYSDGKQRR